MADDAGPKVQETSAAKMMTILCRLIYEKTNPETTGKKKYKKYEKKID